MKKTIQLLSLLAVAVVVISLQSCKEDETFAVPVATAPSAVASVQVGTKADVTFTFVAAGGYASSLVAATGGTVAIKTDGTADATEGSVVVEFTADQSAGAATVSLTITDAKGQAGNTATATLNKTISAPPAVTLSSATGSANPGGTVQVTATVAAANGFKSLTYTTTSGLTGTPASPINAITGATQVLTFTVPATAAIGSTMTAVITVTDNQSLNSTAQTFTVTAATNELTGILSANKTLNKGESYLIKGTYSVATGVTLTVQAGAVIKGDKASKGVLVIKQGGTLIANGTATEPIVFTSSQPVGERDRGDWGGIVIMGDAFINQTAKASVEGLTPPANDADFFKYGTPSTSDATVGNNTQNSGSLKYVRIEYAGIELIPNSETNGLTMAGVGSGTTIDFVQSSYGGDDGFEWFGGTVGARHLVSFATWDDDFDTDFGWRGNVQWAVAVRAPFVADQSGSTAFESDSQGNANAIGTICTDAATTGCTQGVFSNVTVLGPRDFNIGTGSGAAPGVTRAISANFTRAMHIRRRTAISIFNSFISGWGAATGVQALTMDDAGTLLNYTTLSAGVLANNVLLFPDITTDAEYSSNAGGVAAVKPIWEAVAAANTLVKPVTGALWSPVAGTPAGSINVYSTYGITSGNASGLFYGSQTTSNYPSNPNFALAAGGTLLTGALFTNGKLGTFFDTTIAYKGAFGATDWTDGWSEFQPLNKAY